jgi:pimeloyl-ACP methyl ester carboxylesterase
VATIVCIHGGFGGGWEWRGVARKLTAMGHEVFTPTMTGMGERIHLLRPDTDLETHAADVMGVLRAERLEHVVLCGQSYGGMIGTIVADRVPELLDRLVYVDALIPRDGDSVFDVITEEGVAMFKKLADVDANRVAPPVEGTPRPGSYDSRLTAHPYLALASPARLTSAGAKVPTWYLRCTGGDPVSALVEPSAERARSMSDWRYLELESPHDAHWFKTDEVVALLDSAAKEAAAS